MSQENLHFLVSEFLGMWSAASICFEEALLSLLLLLAREVLLLLVLSNIRYVHILVLNENIYLSTKLVSLSKNKNFNGVEIRVLVSPRFFMPLHSSRCVVLGWKLSRLLCKQCLALFSCGAKSICFSTLSTSGRPCWNLSAEVGSIGLVFPHARGFCIGFLFAILLDKCGWIC